MKEITVLYESDCKFCNACKRFAERRDRDERIHIYGYESDTGSALMEKHSELRNMQKKSIAVITPKGEIFYKYKACRIVALYMNAPWPFISRMCALIPQFIGDFGYDLVAKNRRFLSRITR